MQDGRRADGNLSVQVRTVRKYRGRHLIDSIGIARHRSSSMRVHRIMGTLHPSHGTSWEAWMRRARPFWKQRVSARSRSDLEIPLALISGPELRHRPEEQLQHRQPLKSSTPACGRALGGKIRSAGERQPPHCRCRSSRAHIPQPRAPMMIANASSISAGMSWDACAHPPSSSTQSHLLYTMPPRLHVHASWTATCLIGMDSTFLELFLQSRSGLLMLPHSRETQSSGYRQASHFDPVAYPAFRHYWQRPT
nr:hypothetical protein CFP56_34658 [Quercus suber]